MKKNLTIVKMILSLVLVLGASFASADGLNPGQFPFSIFQMPDLMYMGSNTGTQDGLPCALEATHDNRILAWFGTGLMPDAILPSRITYCISVYPNDPSEVVNTAEYLSSSQKNYIGVSIEDGPCRFLRPAGLKPAVITDGFYWSDHVPGLSTGTANPVVGISMVKLQDAAIADSAGYDYEAIANSLFAAGFKLDKKGFWVNQCYGGPFLQTLEH